ncbi:MAG: hypothetical protein L6R41_006533 [Letrouitia leprolyta]|nr:MAG: hypothetical protein L6R41_006533 [Letrouitia leprolyta]
MSRKRPYSPSPSPTPRLYISAPLTSRSSTFIAHFSPTLSPQTLRSHPSLVTATHRMTAWRYPSSQKTIHPSSSKAVYETGHDDDGEKFGGKTVERVLVEQDVVGAVVVARWYGGIMLGPKRFELMRECAGEAVGRWKAAENHKPGVAKRRIGGSQEGGKPPLPSVGRGSGDAGYREMFYEGMEVKVLERLEGVRDKTIGWILKEIERVEDTEAKGGKMVVDGVEKDIDA